MRRRNAFADKAFDAVISRNVLWNLPHPEGRSRNGCAYLNPAAVSFMRTAIITAILWIRSLNVIRQHACALRSPAASTCSTWILRRLTPLPRRCRLHRNFVPQWDLHALIDLGFTETQVIEPSLAEVSDPLSGKKHPHRHRFRRSSDKTRGCRLLGMSQLRPECPETPSAALSSSTFALSDCLMLTRRTLLLSAAAASLAMLPFASFAAGSRRRRKRH